MGTLNALVVQDKVVWATGQEEKGEKEGAHHIQVIIRWKTAQRLSACQSAFARTDHWEICDKPAAAANYCNKPDTAIANSQFTVGDVSKDPRVASKDGKKATRDGEGEGRGARTDLKNYVADIAAGMKQWELLEKYPHVAVQYPRAFGDVTQVLDAKRRATGKEKATDKVDIKVVVLWGPTGTGKSHWARHWIQYLVDTCGYTWTASAPVVQGDMVWGDNYMGEEIVLMDDFNPANLDEEMFLRFLDVWARPTVNRKGKPAIPLRVTWWFFTSNHDPASWYAMFHLSVPLRTSRYTVP